MMRVHVPKSGNEKLSSAVHACGSLWNGKGPADIGDLSSLSQNRHRGLPRTARHIYESHVRDGDRVVPLAPNAGFLLYWLSGCNVFAGSKAETKDYRYKNQAISCRAARSVLSSYCASYFPVAPGPWRPVPPMRLFERLAPSVQPQFATSQPYKDHLTTIGLGKDFRRLGSYAPCSA